jgi:hypothetical protein
LNPRRREFYELRKLGAQPLSPRTGESLTKGCEESQYRTEELDIRLFRETGFSLRPLPALWDLLDSDKEFQNVLEFETRDEPSRPYYLEATDTVLEQEVRDWLEENANPLVGAEEIPEEPEYSILDKMY